MNARLLRRIYQPRPKASEPRAGPPRGPGRAVRPGRGAKSGCPLIRGACPYSAVAGSAPRVRVAPARRPGGTATAGAARTPRKSGARVPLMVPAGVGDSPRARRCPLAGLRAPTLTPSVRGHPDDGHTAQGERGRFRCSSGWKIRPTRRIRDTVVKSRTAGHVPRRGRWNVRLAACWRNRTGENSAEQECNSQPHRRHTSFEGGLHGRRRRLFQKPFTNASPATRGWSLNSRSTLGVPGWGRTPSPSRAASNHELAGKQKEKSRVRSAAISSI